MRNNCVCEMYDTETEQGEYGVPKTEMVLVYCSPIICNQKDYYKELSKDGKCSCYLMTAALNLLELLQKLINDGIFQLFTRYGPAVSISPSSGTVSNYPHSESRQVN